MVKLLGAAATYTAQCSQERVAFDAVWSGCVLLRRLYSLCNIRCMSRHRVAEPDKMRATDLILDRFASLSPKLQTAARFVADHPNEVVIASMRTLAERAKLQPATLVRLAQQLGYSGWPDLKSAVAEELGLHSASYGQRAKTLTARRQKTDLLSEMFIAQRQNLDLTEAHCVDAVHQAVKLLKSAKSVHVAGFRASFSIAYALFYGYRLFRDTVHLIDSQGGGLEMQLRPIGPRDVVVAISFAPYSRETLSVIEAAQRAGAHIVALTDSSTSPLALAADVEIIFSGRSPSFFPSAATAVAVTESLLELLVADGGDAVVQKIEQAEQQLFDLGAYVEPPPRRQAVKR